MANNKFIVIVPVYNSEKYIKTCLESILSQDYENFRLIVIDDGSVDDTSNIIDAVYAKHNRRFLIHKNAINLTSALSSFIQGTRIGSKNDEDILVTVDGDDFLAHNNVLSYLNEIYQDEAICMTYGQFEPISQSYHDFCGPIQDTMAYRKSGKWLTSHPRTFKRKVFDLIKDDDLRDTDGKYYKFAGELALMFPLVEMCGSRRIRFISKILYIYNDLNPMNEMKLQIKKQLANDAKIRNKQEYEELP